VNLQLLEKYIFFFNINTKFVTFLNIDLEIKQIKIILFL
jgi:hypothetical protein